MAGSGNADGPGAAALAAALGGAPFRRLPGAGGLLPPLHRAGRQAAACLPHLWRITAAGHLLCQGDLPLRVVTSRTGYASEFASTAPSSASTASAQAPIGADTGSLPLSAAARTVPRRTGEAHRRLNAGRVGGADDNDS